MSRSAIGAAAACAAVGLAFSPAATRPAAPPAAIDFWTATDGDASMPDGRVLATADGGSTWRYRGRTRQLAAVAVVSPTLAFGLGGRDVLRSRDGGRTWRRVHRFPVPRGGGPPAGEMAFVDERRGWAAAGGDLLYRTSDGGRRWTTSLRCGRLDQYVGGVSFLDRRHGFAVCGGQPATIMQHRTYLRTSDGGTTWHGVRSGFFTGHVTELEYVSPRMGFEAADRDGLRSVTGGRARLFTDDVDGVVSMSWPSARVGYAVLFHGGLFRTTDGGRTWRRTGPWGTGRLPPR